MKLLLLASVALLSFAFIFTPNRISTYHVDDITAVNWGSNPPAARTGAPGESTCTVCHAAEVMSSDGVVSFSMAGGPEYVPGEIYPITISTVGGPRNGFEMTILDEDNNRAGTFSAGDNSSVASSDGREYIRHENSTGITSWTFDWEAPAVASGPLTAYYIMNKSNNNGNSRGDEIFIGNELIPLTGTSSISAIEILDQSFDVHYVSKLNKLQVKYKINEPAHITINVQDLSGKIISSTNYGVMSAGEDQKQIAIDDNIDTGIYVVSIFIDNKVLNRKVFI
ncbi:choice-of-anchor V domain-containing protein [Crocinitomix catalasitica]|uniref:choice-of-anchor V domain-containing protein n=1 Tax=Crocinitomix catalasitica TaxID=184607 RepID=UPI000486FFCA|nr:choice-of-anchor V domain-containing protein [Crocinitomix catalasitica]